MPPQPAELDTAFAATFYTWQCVACLTWWLLVFLGTKRPIWAHARGSVFTRPPYLPKALLHALRRHSFLVFVLAPTSMAFAAANAHVFLARLCAALCFSIYHLLETSASNRHGEYPLLACMWLLLLPPPLAHPLCMGAVLNFVVSAAAAKLLTPSARGEWLRPDTMRVYLEAYRCSRTMPPLLPHLTDLLLARPWALSCIAAATLLLELLLVPLIPFLAPPPLRIISAHLMMAMHVGIALVQSFKLCLIFCTTLPTYFLAFSCTSPPSSPPCLLAAAIALQPLLFTVPETWPLSPVSLFMWSGRQARALARMFMCGDTRLVLATRSCTRHAAVGCAVRHHGLLVDGGSAGSDGAVVELHDAVLRVLGFTLLQGDASVRRALLSLLAAATQDAPLRSSHVTLCSSELAGMQGYVAALQQWLAAGGRLVEGRSGLQLERALFVRVGDDGRVTEVLL